jgi:5S rRNA maturation endonuclease (ribonuclease M5)
MISLETVTAFMLQHFEKVTITSNGTHFLARCLLCGDSKKSERKKRFNLDWKNGKPVYKCWNCGKSGSFFKLYMIVNGCSEEETKRALFKYNAKKIVKSLENPIIKGGVLKTPDDFYKDKPESDSLTPPGPYRKYFNRYIKEFTNERYKVDSILFDSWMKILNDFRNSRKIPYNYEILYAWTGEYQGRIIIPIFDKFKNLIYFQARRLPGADVDPKYKNPISKKETIVLNEYKFRDDRYIIITEGLLDAFMIGNQGTTCLGKEMSEYLIRRIEKHTNLRPGIILVYDNDEDGQKALRKFMKTDLKKMVKYFIMPKEYIDCKDINNIRVKYDIKDMYDFVVKNSYEFYAAVVKLGGCER